jgi:DNA-directed RNA polymerase specialized sigma24 family protein
MLPKIVKFARSAFRQLNAEQADEAVQEVVAQAWRTYRRLAELGREELAYPTPLARFAIARYRAGRRVGQSANGKDACSPVAALVRGHQVYHLNGLDGLGTDIKDGLVDYRRAPVPDQAAFRIDFPAWISTQVPRDRRIILALAIGDRPREIARRFRITDARVSQLRRKFELSWQQFHGELVAC